VKFLSAITAPEPGTGTRNISRGYLALFATVVIWSLPSLFQFYLLRYYDVWAQNFYRYSVAYIAIAPSSLFVFGEEAGRDSIFARSFSA
jgi:drug/metabolite transporter (DMT)-like permease